MDSNGPDFVCIGAQKAGTTWLYDNLVGHSGVWMPPIKELHFFNRICPNEELLGLETGHAAGYRSMARAFSRSPSLVSARWLYRYHVDELSTQSYYRLFDMAPQDKAAGDITPAYSTLDRRGVEYASRVLKPDCKILLILRNPIERLWSGVKMLYRWEERDVTEIPVDQILRDTELPSNNLRTSYDTMIETWSAHFGSQFHVLLYDDLLEGPRKFLETVHEILGLEHIVENEALRKRSNADKTNIRIPTELRDILTSRFETMIQNIDSNVPGVADRWLAKHS